MKAQNRVWPIFSLLVFAGILVGCSTAKQVQSVWRDKKIAIGGQGRGWGERTAFYDEKNHLILAVANDSEALYLRIFTADRRLQQAMRHLGMTLWFDPEGGKEKSFGIRFPTEGGMPGPGRAGMDRHAERKPEKEPFLGLEPEVREEAELLFPATGNNMIMSVRALEQTGMRLKMGQEKNLLVYELKIPFSDPTGVLPFRLAGRSGQCIGIGLFVGGSDADKPPPGPSGEEGGMRPGPQGGGPGGMPPPQDMGKGGRPESLEIWIRVRLADGRGRGK